MKTLQLFPLALLLTGCLAPRIDTASGKPEITVQLSLEEARTRLATEAINRGYDLKVSDSLHTVFEKTDTSYAYAILLSPTLDPYLLKRLQFTFLPATNSLRIIGSPRFIQGNSFGHEQEAWGLYPAVQEMLWMLDPAQKKEIHWVGRNPEFPTPDPHHGGASR